VLLSATPLPIWAYSVLGSVTLIWLVAERGQPGARSGLAGAAAEPGTSPSQTEPHHALTRRCPGRRCLRIVVAVIWLSAAGFELRWHVIPRISAIERPRLAVLGDSVTAGIGEEEAVTWPRRLSEDHGIPVDDFSQMGATVASARAQAGQLRPEHNLVLLEIGGNDLLGATSSEQFSRGLEQLLDDVCRPDRTVVMFELPLPPFFNAEGALQRQAARTRGVVLIPKRVLMSVLCRNDTTLDSIHLSQAGHDALANSVWSIVQPAYGAASERR
jgi:acyl-CoA thioesterase-1